MTKPKRYRIQRQSDKWKWIICHSTMKQSSWRTPVVREVTSHPDINRIIPFSSALHWEPQQLTHMFLLAVNKNFDRVLPTIKRYKVLPGLRHLRPQ